VARRFAQGRGRSSRRQTVWLGIGPTHSALGAASTATLFTGLSAAQLAMRPFTIIRTRGIIGIKSDQQAANEFQHAALGMAVVSDQALAIGVTAVPTPDTDRDSDLFFVYEELAAEFVFTTGAAFNSDGMTSRTFDSKAMRKVEEGSDIAITIETTSTSSGVTFTKAGRMLIKTH